MKRCPVDTHTVARQAPAVSYHGDSVNFYISRVARYAAYELVSST